MRVVAKIGSSSLTGAPCCVVSATSSATWWSSPPATGLRSRGDAGFRFASGMSLLGRERACQGPEPAQMAASLRAHPE